MLEAFLLVGYATLFSWSMRRWHFFTQSGLSQWQLQMGFWLKIMGATAYGLVYWHYYGGGDTWAYLQYAKHIFYETLPQNPLYFLELVFLPNARTPPPYLVEIIEPIVGWSDVRTYTMYRVNALLLFFSGGNYYVHAGFFAILSMTGLVALYRTFFHRKIAQEQHWQKQTTHWAYGVLFCVPSLIFWASGVHKEALTLFCLGMVLYQLLGKSQNRPQLGAMFLVLACLGLLGIMRPYVVTLLLPALAAWYLAPVFNKKWKMPVAATYLLVYGFGAVLISLLPLVANHWHILAKLQAIQYVFVQYESGGSDIYLPLIAAPTWWELAKVLPHALYNTTFRVLWLDTPSFLRLCAALETVVICAIVVWAVWRNRFFYLEREKKNKLVENQKQLFFWKNTAYFCAAFGTTYLLLIGILVGNMGALVRYRTTPMLFVFMGMLLVQKYQNNRRSTNI